MSICKSCGIYVDPKRTTCRACTRPVVGTTRPVFGGQYELERELGRGGMGVVYLARDLRSGRRVALKTLPTSLARNEDFVQRLAREAAVLASIRHPQVVGVHTFGTSPTPYFVMDFVEGESLGELLAAHVRTRLPIPERRVVWILRQIAGALDAVHEAGIVHRDVKPDNVIIEERSGRPVLVDFGLAVPMNTAPSRRSVGCGTPEYMAPEQAAPVDGSPAAVLARQADIYALGCTAYELLTGLVPFESENPIILANLRENGEVTPPSEWRPELASFDEPLLRALAKDPRARFSTAAELAEALERAVPALAHAPSPVSGIIDRRLRDNVRVLVVDDDDAIVRYAGRAAQLAFHRRPISLVTARSGEAALTCAAEDMPDLLVLDYSMPGLDGIETLTRLREMPGGEAARVLVFSANAGNDERCRFALLGVSDFLAKPASLQDLVRNIAAIGESAGWFEQEPEAIAIQARA